MAFVYCVAFVASVWVSLRLLCCISWRINGHYVVISSIHYLLLYVWQRHRNTSIFAIFSTLLAVFLSCVCFVCVCFFGRISFCESKTPRTENWVIFCRCICLSNIRHLYFMALALDISRCDNGKNKMQIIFSSFRINSNFIWKLL